MSVLWAGDWKSSCVANGHIQLTVFVKLFQYHENKFVIFNIFGDRDWKRWSEHMGLFFYHVWECHLNLETVVFAQHSVCKMWNPILMQSAILMNSAVLFCVSLQGMWWMGRQVREGLPARVLWNCHVNCHLWATPEHDCMGCECLCISYGSSAFKGFWGMEALPTHFCETLFLLL